MKPNISDLVTRYESGRLSRRDLIQGLTMLVVAGQATAAADVPAKSLTATGIDHVSVLVSNLERSAQFYQSLFDLKPLSADKAHNILRLGNKRVIVSLRHDAPHGTVDHFGVAIDGFDKEAATALLKQRQLDPQENWEYGFHIKDPDGVVVQML